MVAQAIETGYLKDCAAIVVAHDAADSAALVALARKVGFGSVAPQATPVPMGHRLPFFLVHYGIGLHAKQLLLAELRGAAATDIRFAPIVLFVPDGPGNDILTYIEMGFDDVICLPENGHVLTCRLAKQVDQEHLFIETRGYLGPDRRRMELPGHTHPGRTGGHPHTRLTILRTPGIGVQVLHKQHFIPAH